MMKRPLLVFSCGLSLAVVGFAATPSHAQTQTNNPNYQQSESTSIYGNNQNFDPYSIIHNMRLNRDASEFQEQTQSGFGDAAATYHNQLLQYWQTQKQKTQEPTVNNTEIFDHSPDTQTAQ